jgi:hypothetical protein
MMGIQNSGRADVTNVPLLQTRPRIDSCQALSAYLPPILKKETEILAYPKNTVVSDVTPCTLVEVYLHCVASLNV